MNRPHRYAKSTWFTGGIGREIALALAQHGTTALVSADIELNAAESVIAKAKDDVQETNAGFQAYAMQVDVTNEASVQQMVDEVKKRFGRIDYFVNSSGVSPSLP